MTNIKNFFIENGYTIFKQIIHKEEIDLLLNCFKNFKIKNSLYYSQSNHNWRKTRKDCDEFGLLKNSIENFTSLFFEAQLAKIGRKILLSSTIDNCLKKISGSKDDFCMWQNMFFDRSVGTIDHIDTWYLDTDPRGYLIGAWIALEDIDGKGGSFHIYPGSHKMQNTEWKNLNHDQFAKWSNKIKQKYKKVSVYLKKGDVLFWHPNLIHGSSNQEHNGFSRKSLTAHYHPICLKRGGGGIETKIDTHEYKKNIQNTMYKITKFDKMPIYSSNNWETIKYSLKGLIKYYTGYKNSENSLMQRDAYNFENEKKI